VIEVMLGSVLVEFIQRFHVIRYLPNCAENEGEVVADDAVA
jgi:hypothetical protein